MVLIAIGTWVILLSTAPSKTRDERRKYPIGGIIFGLAGGATWGLTPILVRVAVLSVKSPLLSTLISYVFAAIICPLFLIRAGHGKDLRNIDKPSFVYLLSAGASVCMAQIFRYSALLLANASFVASITNMYPVFTLVLSYMFIQKIEKISLKVVTGILLSVLGLYVVILT